MLIWNIRQVILPASRDINDDNNYFIFTHRKLISIVLSYYRKGPNEFATYNTIIEQNAYEMHVFEDI